jgi:hypothetical protein
VGPREACALAQQQACASGVGRDRARAPGVGRGGVRALGVGRGGPFPRGVGRDDNYALNRMGELMSVAISSLPPGIPNIYPTGLGGIHLRGWISLVI